jgi:hypothetical protein
MAALGFHDLSLAALRSIESAGAPAAVARDSATAAERLTALAR